MSIVPLAKVSLCGAAADKSAVMEGLQDLGCLHLIPLVPPPAAPDQAPPARAEEALRALAYLAATPRRRRPVRRAAGFDLAAVVARARANQDAIRRTLEERDTLTQYERELAPWGAFTLPPLDQLGDRRLWFYVVPLTELGRVSDRVPWVIVHRDHRVAYVVAIAHDEPPADAMPVARSHVGSTALAELRRRLDELEVTLEDLAAEREALSRWTGLIARNLAAADDRAARAAAAAATLDRDGVFAVQGWAPDAAVGRLKRFAERAGLVLLVEPPGPADTPPTLLDPPAAVAGGGDIVRFYKTPAYHGWDPSAVVFGSFALFFAMITADAGYGLVFGALLALVWGRLGAGALGRRLRRLGVVMVAATVGYGVLTGGYFGMAPPAGSLLAGLAWLDLTDYGAMMALSIVVGVGHLCLAHGAVARAAPDWRRRARPLGWIAALVGGLFVWRAGAGAAGTFGWLLIVAGLAAVALFADPRPVHDLKDALRRGLAGLVALTGVTAAFGDVLSYMRLFALGLASGSLALTFNRLAGDVSEAVPGLGLFLSLLILVAGHGLNLALCLMSGVVHGLRLNFIEFFNWGLPDEGRPFHGFRRTEVER